MALSDLFEATKQFIVCGCLWPAWVCSGRTMLHTKARWMGRSAKDPRHPKILIHLPPPAPTCLHLWAVCPCLPLLAPPVPPLPAVTERASGSTQIAQGRISVSHQVEVSGVYQITIGSNLVPMMSLRLLKYIKSSSHPLGAHITLWLGGVSRSH